MSDAVERVSDWLGRSADEIDRLVHPVELERVLGAIHELNRRAAASDPEMFYRQQLLLSRIYTMQLRVAPGEPSAEGSTALHRVTRLLEQATAAAEDSRIEAGALDNAPAEPAEFVSWLKKLARRHTVFKHPYYTDFIRDRADSEAIRRYMIQESVIDGRFDDLLALMQVGTSGPAKMEIARNFWDEMGNGNPAEVHTHLFKQIFEVFDITDDELEIALTANALLSGNLAVMLCRYRSSYPEAVGFLGMTEWLVPDRFVQVVHAWDRLGLPDVGIVYHRLHITVDAQHAAGWFHNVIKPAATSPAMRRGIARGTLWRLNSSQRYLDERMSEVDLSARLTTAG
ncbi:iron-containing redox enzyme family protein [Lentzea sp. HUAS12]|uniref:iron-containing redox enzyme family protein n=1 Tax=Lentzea sp. HUAS12 TaxID=2951806 RepID=UPI00209CFD7C|nr:iron-containing redox enzyme family protein [Lentzea sp. HUAS12]USX55461.1 iron-containing redox enzyme family protein [Lentzea sp. HUAS12]